MSVNDQAAMNEQLTALRKQGLGVNGDNLYKADVIDVAIGAMLRGFQGGLEPPEGHWCWRFYEIGKAEREERSRIKAERDEARRDLALVKSWRLAAYNAEECLTGCLASPEIAKHLDQATVRTILERLSQARIEMLAASEEAIQPAAHMEYRLLRAGEIIQAEDELLRDDCITWQAMKDGSRWAVGSAWHTGLVPVRRFDSGMPSQGDKT